VLFVFLFPVDDVEPTDTLFSPDYFTARRRFLEAAAGGKARLETIPLDAKGPNGEELGIDVAWFGPPDASRALIHSSGLHGVEGFAGSAIQLQFLQNFSGPPRDTVVVIVHILNPYGMSWLRRVNENNVDLNRNFLDRPYAGAPARYAELNRFLNPPYPPGPDFYYLKAAYWIYRYGMPGLRQVVAGGQYSYPKGLFFGGKQMEQGAERYQSMLASRLSGVEQAVAIDVHTGLGPYAEDTLLVEASDYSTIRSLFGSRVTAPHARDGPAYRVEGGMQSMLFRVFTKTRPRFICQEFGTYSGVKVVHALREENRWHHYGRGGLDHPTKQKLKRTFCPDDPRWRESVLQRGAELLKQAMEEFRH
jgi:hypothetical protein